MVSPLKKLEGRIDGHSRGEGGALPYDPTGEDRDVLISIPLHLVDPDPDQPRKDLGELKSLQDSIEEHGLIQPIVVHRLDNGRFLILAGHRRFTAYQQLGRTEIPAVLRSQEEHKRVAVQLVENVERKDLNPFEIAQSYVDLMTHLGFDQEQLAEYLRISPNTVSETLSLNRLPAVIREEGVRTSVVSRSLLVELGRIPSEARQLELWEVMKEGRLTVRQLREERPARRPAAKKTPAKPAGYRQVITVDGTTVTIQFERSEVTEAEVAQVLAQALRTLQPAASLEAPQLPSPRAASSAPETTAPSQTPDPADGPDPTAW